MTQTTFPSTEDWSVWAPSGLWKTLNDNVAFANYVPCPVTPALVEDSELIHKSGESYHVIKQRDRRTYLSLPPNAYELWTMMDGSRTVRELALQYFMQHKQLVSGLLRGLVQELREQGFLTGAPIQIFRQLDRRREKRAPDYWLMALLQSVISRNLVVFRKGDAALGIAYRTVGWVFFGRFALMLMAAVVIAGFGAWCVQAADARYSLFKIGDSFVAGFVVLTVIDTLSLTFHELGHALAVKRYGREVNAIGILLYYGSPCAYVNTTDIWMADRKARIVVSFAGPFVTLFIAGLAGLLALGLPAASLAGDIAFKTASIGFFSGVLQFVPLLELDGYFMLVDWLEMPLLRARSFNFLRHELRGKLHDRRPLTRDEWILTGFGIVSSVFSVAILAMVIWGWKIRGAGVAADLWNFTAWYGKPLLLLFLVLFLGPLLVGITTVGARATEAGFRRLSWLVRERRLEHRAERVLAAMPFLQHLQREDWSALADHVSTRHVPAGISIVRQGDPPDGFYILQDGEADVEQLDHTGTAQRVARLVPGDHFGELSYLNNAPRNATVRARGNVTVDYFGGGQFRRWIEADITGRADLRKRMIDYATFESFPFLSSMTSAERSDLLRFVEVLQFDMGETIFRADDVGDKLYFIVSGACEVFAPGPDDSREGLGRCVARLQTGDYFGEIALLADTPRTASVKSVQESVCYALSREGFERLLDTQPRSRRTIDALASERNRQTRAKLGVVKSLEGR